MPSRRLWSRTAPSLPMDTFPRPHPVPLSTKLERQPGSRFIHTSTIFVPMVFPNPELHYPPVASVTSFFPPPSATSLWVSATNPVHANTRLPNPALTVALPVPRADVVETEEISIAAQFRQGTRRDVALPAVSPTTIVYPYRCTLAMIQ
jgi:hypothetical protein